MKHGILILLVMLTLQNVSGQNNSNAGTRGLFDFKDIGYNSIIIAELKEPALFTLYRYGDGGTSILQYKS